MTLSSATNPGQNEPVSDGNKGVLRIPQCSSLTGASPSGCLVSLVERDLPLCRDAIRVFCSPTRPSSLSFLKVKHFYLTHRYDPIKCYHSWSE